MRLVLSTKLFCHCLYTGTSSIFNKSRFFAAQNRLVGWKHLADVFVEKVFQLIFGSVCLAATEGARGGVWYSGWNLSGSFL